MPDGSGPAALDETPVAGGIPLLAVPGWESRYGFRAGVTARGDDDPGFDLGLGQGEPHPAVLARWERLLAEHPGFDGLVVGRQVHGTRVDWHTAVRGVELRPGADGQATARPGVLLCATAADCVPVYVIDPVRRAAALLHAGWRGARDGILAEGVRTLAARAGSRARDLIVHCGVGICGGCYEVGPEVLEAFGLGGERERGHLDLRGVLERQARKLGIGQVTVSRRCSAHEPESFFSHRASRGLAGRMAAYLGIVP